MFNFKGVIASAALTILGATSAFASTASVSLTDILQSISVSNDGGSSANIETIIYSLGTPGDGIATWDTRTGGGTASDFLSDPRYFQTVTWSGLSIAPGASFATAGFALDIDKIVTLSPLSVTGATSTEQNTDPGISLSNAFVSVFWSDGSSGSAGLLQQPWNLDQQLRINSQAGVIPLPASLPLLFAGLLGFVGLRRFRRA
jgi:hypothetical protein